MAETDGLSSLCGCGGIGRRAALRALWGKPRGGSSPLSRTKRRWAFRRRGGRLLDPERRMGYGSAPLLLRRSTGYAAVAELVDALASGASFRMEVEVRVLSAAPTPGRFPD